MKFDRLVARAWLLFALPVCAGAGCGDDAEATDPDLIIRPDTSTSDTTAGDATATDTGATDTGATDTGATDTGAETDVATCTQADKVYLDLDGDGVCGAGKQCPVTGVKTCLTIATANDCNDADAAIFPRNYEPTVSGTASKTDKKDNDCDGHTDEDDLKITIAFDPAIANGTFVNTTSTVVTTVKVKATVTISGWVDDAGTLTASIAREASNTQSSQSVTMKNGSTVLDFGDATLSTTQIANGFAVTIAGWDDEVVAARTVIYNLAGRRPATATIGTTKGTTVGGAMGMAMNSAMTGRMFTNMSSDLEVKFNTDYMAYPAESEGVGITSKWGQPVHVMEDQSSDEWNFTWDENDWIDGYEMYTKMAADSVKIEVIPYDGTASGLPNDTASTMTSAEKNFVTANSMTMRFTLKGVQLDFREQDFKCKIAAGCTSVNGVIQSLHDDLADNSLSNYSDDGATVDYYSIRIEALRFEFIGMLVAPLSGTELAKSWSHGQYGAVDRNYPDGAVCELPDIDANNDPYLELVSKEGQLAFVIAKMKLLVQDEDMNWVTPTDKDDIELTLDYSQWYSFLDDTTNRLKAAIYGLGRDFPTNVALKNEILVEDGGDDDTKEDKFGYMFLSSMYNGILGRANPEIAFAAKKSSDTLVATSDHHVEAGDKLKMKTVPASSGLTAGSTYYVKEVVDARTLKLSTTATGALLDLKADGNGSFVEGPFGVHPGRFATEYDLFEHAMDSMYAKQWSSATADTKLRLKQSGKTSYSEKFTTNVDIGSDLALAFTYGTRVVLPTVQSGKSYQNGGQYINGGSAVDMSGDEDQVARVRFSESMLNAAFYAEAPYGSSRVDEAPFDCNSDGTMAADELLVTTLNGRAPYVEMATTAQGYDLVMEGVELSMAPKGSCILSGPSACLAGQSKPSDPVNAAKSPVFLGNSRLAMRFAAPSDAHLREAEDNYVWAQGGGNLCGTGSSKETPMAMFNEVQLAASGAMVGNKFARAGCGGDALAGKLTETLTAKMTAATLNAIKAKACGDEYPVGVFANAFDGLIPIGIDLSGYANVSAFCADESEDAPVATTYLQRQVSDDAAVSEVLVGGPANKQVALTAGIAMVEWDGDAEGDLCADEGVDLCPEYFTCETCCPDGQVCVFTWVTPPFDYIYECK